MTTEEKISHNIQVIKRVVEALLDQGLVDKDEMMSNPTYAKEMFWSYITAANITREMMNMKPLVLYDISES